MTLNLTTTRPFNADVCLPWSGIKRVALKPDGTVYKYHNLTTTGDSVNAMFSDGTIMSWSDYESAGYNCMVEIPKFYYKKVGFNESTTDFNNGHAWYISDSPTDGYELHPAFMRCRDKLCDDLTGVATEVDYRYAPAFLGWKDSNGKLRSLPFKTPTVNITIGTARNYAKANGNGWGIKDFNLLFAIQLLYSVEYGNYDSQTALGRGYVDGNSSSISTGGTLSSGNKSYGETTGKKQMSYRGIEDLWGNCRYWVDGFFCSSSSHILMGNKGFNDTGNGYSDKGINDFINIGGYIGNIQSNKDYGFVISASNGSTTTKLYDFGYLSAGYLPVAGASWANASFGGVFAFDCSFGASGTSSLIAASLCF
ncbi:hypothetical protein [Clostridium sp. HV4-5-A1G]|uniref:hypothetical protein n=1 Tax=Clostridium sp. HV4-5-A1G TaxID=2004595 RepID=UPI0012394795|nr:hypothetical protein [Clostridium sp. HV4-5-A1G]KAA8676215.1 hypothetical protein F3O63_03850 [Clostridium sp. HV4-5-A1G]